MVVTLTAAEPWGFVVLSSVSVAVVYLVVRMDYLEESKGSVLPAAAAEVSPLLGALVERSCSVPF